MSDYTPKFKGGTPPITKIASAAITGGQVVVLTAATTVAPSAAADAKWFGVAAHDAAIGQEVSIYKGGVQRPLAGGTIAVGDIVVTGAAGVVVTNAAPGAGQQVGVAVTSATVGLAVQVDFLR